MSMTVTVEAKPKRPAFEGFFVPKEERELPKGNHEKIIVVSDLHGAKAEVVARLHSLADGEDKPAAVILAGDVAGNPDLEELQRLYYNHLTNHTKEALKDEEISNKNLLSYGGTKPPYEGYTIRKGFLQLRAKELDLQGFFEKEIRDNFPYLTDESIAKKVRERRRGYTLPDDYIASEVRRYSNYVHYGHYASNLDPRAIEKLKEGLESNAKQIAAPLKRLQEAGVQVVINEGNWDPSPPIAFEPDIPTAKRLPPEEQPFSTKGFFEGQGIRYVTDMEVIQTKTAAFVLLPFDQLVRFSEMSQEEVETYAKPHINTITKAKEQGKQIIVVQHAEAHWEPHNLTNPDSTPSGEHEKILNGVGKVTRYLQPDEVLYGHFHDPFVDENGVEQPINTKYAEQVVFDNTPVIIKDKRDLGPGQTVVSYMPLQRFATIKIPYNIYNRKIDGFGGTRQPAEVS